MGVRVTDYVLIGADLGSEVLSHMTDKERDEIWEREHNYRKVGDITYLDDGMSGEFFIVGEILAIDVERENFLPMVSLPLDITAEKQDNIERVKAHIKERFGKEVEPRLMVFTYHA